MAEQLLSREKETLTLWLALLQLSSQSAPGWVGSCFLHSDSGALPRGGDVCVRTRGVMRGTKGPLWFFPVPLCSLMLSDHTSLLCLISWVSLASGLKQKALVLASLTGHLEQTAARPGLLLNRTGTIRSVILSLSRPWAFPTPPCVKSWTVTNELTCQPDWQTQKRLVMDAQGEGGWVRKSGEFKGPTGTRLWYTEESEVLTVSDRGTTFSILR